ncbi:zinc ribbon domain-containing protein [Dorea sp. D27]|uniref:zinc ribbon domain-containing protein n=1 Tax=Dorea sp. D27 TaxID=658665 RepID=UPI000A025D2C|nr:zinc ribbon domain-containing protein [Dorea sp. D27]
MWCTKCGKELDENAVTCDACGTEVRSGNVTAQEPEKASEENLEEVEVTEEIPEEASEEAIEEVPDEPKEEAKVSEEETEARKTGDESGKPDEEGDSTPAGGGKKRLDVSTLKKHWLKLALGIAVIVLAVYAVKYYQVKGELAKTNSRYSEVTAEYNSVCTENTSLKDKINTLELENEELKNGAASMLVSIKNSYEAQKWDEVITAAAELHGKYNGTQEDKEAQELAKQSQGQIDAAKAAEESKKAQGYETGITYEQLARTPDDFEGEKVKFSGKVVQVMEGKSDIQIRLAVNDSYDTIMYGSYSPDTVSSRVLEDDHVTIYGTSVGTISYQSTMGGTITIPGVLIEKIDQ